MSDTTTQNQDTKTCWVVSDGRTGIENQARGLAEAVGRLVPLTIKVRRIGVQWPWASLPESTWANRPFKKLSHVLDETNTPVKGGLSEPWPDLWIGSGRLSIPFSIRVREARRSFVVQTQDPRRRLEGFDVVVPPYHDGVSGANVIPIHGAPTRLTQAMLDRDSEKLAKALSHLPNPRVAVLIGGDSKAFRMTGDVIDTIANSLQQLAKEGFGVMVTTSRRTGKANETLIHDKLQGFDNVFFWEGEKVGDLANPYFGMLGLADHILVTQESTNMITEAATTGKPVHILSMERGNTKFRNFHDSLEKQGITRSLSLPLESWSYQPLKETDRAAREIVRRWLGRNAV